MKNKIQFIFVGRLVEEKGFHFLLLAAEKISKLKQTTKNSFHIHIFGKGVLEKEALLASEKYEFITFHGFKPKEDVIKVWKKCHYTLMPSLFLETFGLSALDGLSVGTPVVGFQKGGLSQFVEDDFAIKESKSDSRLINNIKNKIVSLTETFDNEKRKKQKRRMKMKYKSFIRESWYDHFKNLLPKNQKRIMIVSDYKADIGGIENWLHIVIKNLKKEGYKIEFMGGTSKKVSKKGLFINLFKTIGNIGAGNRVKKTIKKFKPDIIWRHSVHRVLGRYPLYVANKKTYRQRIMYHDFGLFHPYPSMVYNEKQLRQSRTFKGFMKEGLKKGRWNAPLLVAKWCSYYFIRKQLKKHINLHLVPSAYMLSSVNSKGYIGKNAAIDVLPHFIDSPK